MDNERLMGNLADVERTSLEKIEVLNGHILQLNERKEQLMQNQNMASQNLEERLKDKYEVRQDLNQKRTKYTNEVSDKTNAKQALHQSICDLEKVIGDYSVEQRRLKTKQATLLTQAVELQADLEEMNLLTEEQVQRLQLLKAKVSAK